MGNGRRPRVGRWGGITLISIACLGCATSYQFEVSEMAWQSNVEKPFEPEKTFAQPAETVYATLMHILEGTGARILSRDNAEGFVSWDHSPTWFRGLSTVGNASGDAAVAPGVVHGSARVKRVADSTLVMLHCVGRDENNGMVVYSNGDYERALFTLLARKIGAS